MRIRRRVWGGDTTFDIEQGAQGRAAAGETRLHGADVHVQNLGDLLVGEAFYFAEDNDGAEGLWELAESCLDALADLSLSGVVEGRMGVVGQGCAEAEPLAFVVGVGLVGRVDGDLLLFVARPPAS